MCIQNYSRKQVMLCSLVLSGIANEKRCFPLENAKGVHPPEFFLFLFFILMTLGLILTQYKV